MNRLILIGNGFDLAHGLKSSTKDFLEDYFLEVINTFLRTNQFRDELIELRFNADFYTNSGKDNPISKEDILSKISSFKSNPNVIFDIKSLLLQSVYPNILNDIRWVDLETEFFRMLTIIGKSSPNNISHYNRQFDFLKDRLVKYLIKQQELLNMDLPNTSIVDCFTEDISKKEIVTKKLFKNEKPDSLYILNFNYTDIILKYQQACNKVIPTNINFIHGSLCKKHGDPIFGFGDEFNKKYVEFEDKNNNELFKHIKSFDYLKNENYHSLIRFIESNEFQIHIYGHSCGISDRTMLNQIFEHTNCKSIKIFYYENNKNENDFTNKTYEISRHINDKTLLRKKLVPFSLSRKMPQPLG